MQIDLIDPRAIKDHPRNDHYYGGVVVSDDFVQSIKEHGVQTNLVVWRKDDGNIICISGHRRKHGAILAELGVVPVRFEHYASDAEAERALIMLNEQREKTERTLIREVEGLSAALSEIAKARSLSNLSGDGAPSAGKTGTRTSEALALHFNLSRDRIDSLRVVWSDVYRGSVIHELTSKNVSDEKLVELQAKWDDVRVRREAGDISLSAAAQEVHAMKRELSDKKQKPKADAKPKAKKVSVVFRKQRDGEDFVGDASVKLIAGGKTYDVRLGQLMSEGETTIAVAVEEHVLPIDFGTLLELGAN